MNDWNVEELKTYCGLMMEDLRGSWAFEYLERMGYLKDALELLIESCSTEDEQKIKEDLEVTLDEIEEPYNGRVFRDICFLYGYRSDEGLTNRVKEELEVDVSYPEFLPWK